MADGNAPADPEAAAAIDRRIDSYLEQLTVKRDVEAAADFYTHDATLLGPDTDLDRAGVMDAIRSVCDAGVEAKVHRRTIELFVHGDVAYEIAQADDTFVNPDGTSKAIRNTLFIRWEKGSDGKWRFARVLLSPREATAQ
jgi:ketosteroid isomerase-like protein